MKWTKEPHSDGDGFFWQSTHGSFYADVELAPWLSAERPWAAHVITGNTCAPVSQSKTASEAKAKVRKHLRATAKLLTAWEAA